MTDISISGSPVTTSGEAVSGFSDCGTFMEYCRSRMHSRTGRSDAVIVDMINDGVWDIAINWLDRDLLYEQSITTVADTVTYTLDTSTYRYMDMMLGSVKFTDSASAVTMLAFVPPHLWEGYKQEQSGASGTRAYTILPKKVSGYTEIEIFPTPSASETLACLFLYWPTEITEDIDNATVPLPAEAKAVLRRYLEYRIADANGDAESRVLRVRADYQEAGEALLQRKKVTQLGRFGRVEAQNVEFRQVRTFDSF